MDKLSEYLPLLIILASLVFTVIGKKKKPDEAAKKTALPGGPKGAPVNEKKLPRTLPGSTPKIFETKPKKKTLNKQEIKPEIKIVPSFSSETAVNPEAEAEDENVNLPFSFENENDIMRAVIYAEIINRKEY